MSGIHALWIPTRDGERACMCCGGHWGGETLPCGDHYCQICVGRGHHEDHDEEECKHGESSPAFHRADRDCIACGKRHADWETCADLIRAYVQTTNSERLSAYRVIDGAVVPA